MSQALCMLYLMYLMAKDHLFIIFIQLELSNYCTCFNYYTLWMQMTT